MHFLDIRLDKSSTRYAFLQKVGFASLFYALITAFSPQSVKAEIPLTRANIESLQNYVELLPNNGNARPARITDLFGLGDIIRTASAARVDLRFNNGSLARIGEQATFQFIPNTRTFCLSNGTALFLASPEQGDSTIETPGAIRNVEGTALVIRHTPAAANYSGSCPSTGQETAEMRGSTVIMALANNPDGPVEITLANGRKAELRAGQMAVMDKNQQLYIFEFDLALFYATSPLVEDLHLNDPDYVLNEQHTDLVRQETLDGLATQTNFVGEYLLNPNFLNSGAISTTVPNWLIPLEPAEPIPSSAESENPRTTPQPLASPDASPDNEASDISPEPVSPNQISPATDEAAITGDTNTVNADILPPGLINPMPDEAPATIDSPPGLINPIPDVTLPPPENLPIPDVTSSPPDNLPNPPETPSPEAPSPPPAGEPPVVVDPAVPAP